MTKLDRRNAIVGLAAFLAWPAAAAAARKPRILFVCQSGTVKSPIARELLKRRALERGIPLIVESRGITPKRKLPPELRQTLASEGLQVEGQPLRRLEKADVRRADIVINFDRLPEGYRPRRQQDWSDLASMLLQYPVAKADLDRRIEALLDQLSPRR